MFGLRKKKQNRSTTDVDACGKPEENSKKKKGLGSSPGLSKIFGSLSDGLNKAGKGGKEKRSFGGSLRDGLNNLGRGNDSPETSGGGKSFSFLKSSKKKQAPPPPIDTTHKDIDRETRLREASKSPIHNNSRVATPLTLVNGHQDRRDSRVSSNSSYGGVNGSQEQISDVSQDASTNHGSMYASSVASGNSSGSSGLDLRIDDDGEDDFGDATRSSSRVGKDGPVPEYARRPVDSWEEDDVIEWLADVGLDYFVDMFQGKVFVYMYQTFFCVSSFLFKWCFVSCTIQRKFSAHEARRQPNF